MKNCMPEGRGSASLTASTIWRIVFGLAGGATLVGTLFWFWNAVMEDLGAVLYPFAWVFPAWVALTGVALAAVSSSGFVWCTFTRSRISRCTAIAALAAIAACTGLVLIPGVQLAQAFTGDNGCRVTVETVSYSPDGRFVATVFCANDGDALESVTHSSALYQTALRA